MAEGPSTIIQLLENASSTGGGISVYAPGTAPTKCNRTPYREFMQRAQINAQSVREIPGISKDSGIILLHFDRHVDNFDWLWAVIFAGYTPAVSTPFVNDPDQRRKHLLHLYDLLEDPIILTTEACKPEFLGLKQLRLHTLEELAKTQEPENGDCLERKDSTDSSSTISASSGVSVRPEDTALLMLTSGSTGNAKAVCLRHDQIIRSVEGKSRILGLDSSDKFLNWIGMDHVANLIEMHLHAIYLGADQVHVQASDLLMEPLIFLQLIDKHRISYTFAPNFFLASLKRALSAEESRLMNVQPDLSCLKTLMCGGEANVVANLVALNDLLLEFGVEDGFLCPGFGMTETCAASMYGRYICPAYEVEQEMEFSTVGTPISGMKVRIMKDEVGVDEASATKEAERGEIGNLQLSGPVVFREYYNNPAATKASFTHDGWFMAGDKGLINDDGYLVLTGRSKETIIVNGVKYFPNEIETAISEGSIPGVTPSFTAVFPHRPKGSETEELCVVYLPTYDAGDLEARASTVSAITQVCLMIASVKPYRILPLPERLLDKSALGKLSRAKIRTAFESGTYSEMEEENRKAIKTFRESKQGVPATELEEQIIDIFCEMFDLPREDAWTGSSLFDFGITSIELIAFKQRVQKRLTFGKEIPVVMLMNNPTIRGMADVLHIMNQGPRPYDPVVTLQSTGTKTPLWLVHPWTGEILVYLSLMKYFIDRPLHALRARGYEEGEEYFESMTEIAETYHAHLKRVQPTGPYAILGYSEGALISYEIVKLLEAQGDEVVFCGILDTTPNIFPIAGIKNLKDILMHLAYLIELTTKEHALSLHDELQKGTLDDAISIIMDLTPAVRLEELELDRAKFHKWVEVMQSLYKILHGYNPRDTVATVDVFIAKESGLIDQETWFRDHMSHWKYRSRAEVEFHECDGNHENVLLQPNILSFQRELKKAFKTRGI